MVKNIWIDTDMWDILSLPCLGQGDCASTLMGRGCSRGDLFKKCHGILYKVEGSTKFYLKSVKSQGILF